jgi:hypothetical protein
MKLLKNQKKVRHKLREIKERKAKMSGQKSLVAPKMKFFKISGLLPDDLPREKRLELIRKIGVQAQNDFEIKYPQFSAWFREYDSIYLLAFCSFYFSSSPEGMDAELSVDYWFYHHYLELIQAFALAQERTLTPKPLQQDAQRLKQEIIEIGEVMQRRLLSIPSEIVAEDDVNAYFLKIEMMEHTIAIRNWAYIHQMKQITISLAECIKKEFESIYGMNPVDLINLLLDLAYERNDLLNAHRKKIQIFLHGKDYEEIINAYNVAFPENNQMQGAAIEELWELAGKKKRNLIEMLIAHSDLKLYQIFSFTLEHAHSMLKTKVTDEVLEYLFERLSYQFGDLKDFDKEHFILGNPVWGRPLINIAEKSYFSAVWGIFPHLVLDILEDLIWAEESIREVYTKAKADFLENETERLFRAAFPNAMVYRGSQWTDRETGRNYENDLMILLDTFALVVEAKSGIVSDPARRGAPKRLFDTLRELIEEPSEQALRFIDYLQRNKKEHSFRTKRGVVNIIDSRKIKYCIPIGVTLSNLGFISSNLKKLIEGKVVNKKMEELALSISLTDLESIFDLLPLEIQKIHYFARRREFEAHMEYEGDELDLLSFYLDNGFNVGDMEYKKEIELHIGIKSKELDSYFIGKGEGKVITKPKLSLTKWWEDLLQVISEKKTEGWVETGFILLNSTKKDQEKFEKMFKKLTARIKAGRAKKAHNWVTFLSGPDRRRYLIVGYPYTTHDKELRNEIINEIISDKNFGESRGCVVIGVNLERSDYPYSILARRLATNLFDSLTLKEIGDGSGREANS